MVFHISPNCISSFQQFYSRFFSKFKDRAYSFIPVVSQIQSHLSDISFQLISQVVVMLHFSSCSYFQTITQTPSQILSSSLVSKKQFFKWSTPLSLRRFVPGCPYMVGPRHRLGNSTTMTFGLQKRTWFGTWFGKMERSNYSEAWNQQHFHRFRKSKQKILGLTETRWKVGGERRFSAWETLFLANLCLWPSGLGFLLLSDKLLKDCFKTKLRS